MNSIDLLNIKEDKREINIRIKYPDVLEVVYYDHLTKDYINNRERIDV